MSVINTNYLAMVSQNNLTKSQSALGTAIERLSSGLRINSAKDDAAGQAIANRFSANINGLQQASRNANDGISVAQTTEGALNEINNNLQRVRVLTVQAANGSNSQTDLDSIQAEISQRLSEINRVSEQTQFNGVRVLAQDGSLKVQIGANDSEAININLSKITSQTLGMDGFNVNGAGTTQNRKATVTDLQAAGATPPSTGNDWTVTTKFKGATDAQVFGKLSTGDKVTVTSGTDYTYDAANQNFSFTDKSITAADTATLSGQQNFKDLAASLKPTTGTKSATYEFGSGDTTSFEIDATGKLTINGSAAYLTTAGELTNNDPGTATQATIEDVLLFTSKAQSTATPAVTVDGTRYTGASSGGTVATLSFTNTISKDALLNTFNSSTSADKQVVLNNGVLTKTVTFATGANSVSDNTYVDNVGDFTNISTYNTVYKVDPTTGEATVKTTDTNVAGTKYEDKVGDTAYVNSDGRLTTATTSQGARTVDPLAAIDAALQKVDGLRGELGAVQNRFQSTITNLSNTITNLSAARSRIEDADYAVEVSNMTRAQILQQAGTSVLAQANQVPQTVLSLLR